MSLFDARTVATTDVRFADQNTHLEKSGWLIQVKYVTKTEQKQTNIFQTVVYLTEGPSSTTKFCPNHPNVKPGKVTRKPLLQCLSQLSINSKQTIIIFSKAYALDVQYVVLHVWLFSQETPLRNYLKYTGLPITNTSRCCAWCIMFRVKNTKCRQSLSTCH